MSDKNKAAARRFYDEVFTRKNLDVIDEVCMPSLVDHNPLPGQPAGASGVKDTIGQYLQAFPDLRFTVHDLVAEGDLVVARFTGEGTHTGPILGAPPTGKRVTFSGIDMIRMKDGRATEVWHEGNDALVMAELGVQIPAAT